MRLGGGTAGSPILKCTIPKPKRHQSQVVQIRTLSGSLRNSISAPLMAGQEARTVAIRLTFDTDSAVYFMIFSSFVFSELCED